MPTPSQEPKNKNVFQDRSQHCPQNCLGGTKAGQQQGRQPPVVDMCVGGHEGLGDLLKVPESNASQGLSSAFSS